MNNFVQPSPQAAALGKYVDYPVSYYTGVPQISVPLYNLKDNGAQVPISLAYHASGIKVSEVASWVGLGWCLNAGGMITRTVRGAPDEGTRKLGLSPVGYYKDSGLKKLPLLPHPINQEMVADRSQLDMQLDEIPSMNAGRTDGEPDLFFFNFNGYTGKFVFDENRTPRLLEDDNLVIQVNFDNSNGQFASWIITTPDGVRYYFGENNVHEITTPHSTASEDDPDANLPSSWYLTSIIYPNTKDTVKFHYTAENNAYYDLGPESKLYNFESGPTGNNGGDIIAICNDNNTGQQTLLRTVASGYRLTSIKSNNDSISFVANTLRLDEASGYSDAKRLDSIKIYTLGQCVKQYALSYDYFNSSLANNITNTGFLNGDTSDSKRLRLLSVREYSGDGLSVKPPYKFSYDETDVLPRRLSYDQDHWGYSNSTDGTTNSWFTPNVSYASNCSAAGGSNRKPKWPQMQAATLLSVQDPLGVVTKFDFEENVVNSYPFTNVGGLRILRITNTDSLSGKSVVRKYSYSTGTLFRQPVYLLNLQNEFYIPTTLTEISGYQGYSSNQYIVGVIKQSSSIVPLQDAQGNSVGYSSVREYLGENGEGGYKDYVFDMNFTNNNSNSRLDLSNFASSQSVNTIFYGTVNSIVGNGHWNDILPQDLQYHTSYDAENHYPYTPDQIELRRGKLLSESTFDSTGNLITKVENTYIDNYHENYPIRGLKIYQSYKWHQPSTNDYDTYYNQAMSFYKLHIGISHLVKSITTNYKDGKQMVTTHNYGYESAYHTLQTSDTTINSQGDTLISKTYYSFDYANTATDDNVFAKMKARNMLMPVATRVWKNNKLLSGTITQYKDFASSGSDTLIYPSKIYSLDITNTLTPAQAGESISLSGLLPTLVPNTHFTEKADFNCDGTTGKVIEQNLINDKTQAIIWDNKSAMPLAVADNTKETDIAYNSFESSETGNWTYSQGYVTADVTAPTGGKVYMLNSTTPLTKSGLIVSKKYILSYWVKSGGSVSISGGTQTNNLTGNTINTSWTNKQVTITTTGSSINITGTGYIDEVRLYPATAQMQTYTYDNILRLLDQCSVNNSISKYEYDGFNRLTDMKDQDGNIIKAFEYNYGELAR